jgi:hypothetical protein
MKNITKSLRNRQLADYLYANIEYLPLNDQLIILNRIAQQIGIERKITKGVKGILLRYLRWKNRKTNDYRKPIYL